MFASIKLHVNCIDIERYILIWVPFFIQVVINHSNLNGAVLDDNNDTQALKVRLSKHL